MFKLMRLPSLPLATFQFFANRTASEKGQLALRSGARYLDTEPGGDAAGALRSSASFSDVRSLEVRDRNCTRSRKCMCLCLQGVPGVGVYPLSTYPPPLTPHPHAGRIHLGHVAGCPFRFPEALAVCPVAV